MKALSSIKPRLRTGAGLALVGAAALAASLTFAGCASTKPEKKVAELSGAQVYAINCNRCHPERYATEWTASQWKTIVMHMRVRANLPAAQARAVLEYLQADAGQ